MVEASLKNSYSPKRLHDAVSPQDLNPCHIVRPNYKLNCVWCTVELKVIGNLECRIKFYREKKPRHFFYTIEYPYPPTNSVEVVVQALWLILICVSETVRTKNESQENEIVCCFISPL
jgi:hypothetical protein